MGGPGELGTGWIPKDLIERAVPSRGIPGAYDYVVVRHRTGGNSIVGFKSYEQGREKWMADSIDFIWFDEEPPADIWTEGMARLTATNGIAILTFTPLKGLSEVVRSFYPTPDSPHKSVTRMELEDALHIDEEMRFDIQKQYPIHEREARLRGIPVLGSGLIYPVPESVFTEAQAAALPKWWPRIGGLDLGGGSHPTAWVALAIDLENDTYHIYDAYKQVEPRISVHAAVIRAKGTFPCAWPKDASTMDRNDGRKYREIYASHGVMMLHEHAQYLDGSVSVEAGLADILNRMTEGRFKIAYHLAELMHERQLYHRNNGKVVKEYDDLMDAMRYAVMMARYAKRGISRVYPSHVGMKYDPYKRQGSGSSRYH